MFCGKCGAELRKGSKFCCRCGWSAENQEQPVQQNSEPSATGQRGVQPSQYNPTVQHSNGIAGPSKMKELLAKHALTICCVISIVALFLPMVKISVGMEIMGESAGSVQTVTGFAAAMDGILGYVLLIGPILLIAMNYIKRLDKYKGILAIVVPALCIIVLIIVFLQARSSNVQSTGGSFGVDINTTIGSGAILAALSYIGTLVAGAVTYHNFTLNKAGLEKLKTNGINFLGTAQEKISETVQTASGRVDEAKAGETPHNGTPKPSAKKSVSVTKAEEILVLIEKLSKMKDGGILTEEEFQEKKQRLLEEI